MTPEDFLTKAVDAYAEARVPLWKHAKLQRGECRSVASVMEDLLAFYLVTRLPSIERVFINQTLIAQGQPRFKPDLVICRGSEICALVDVKIDLGWKRDKFDSTLRQTDTRIAQLRGQGCSLLQKNGGSRKRMALRLSDNAKYLFVVISDQNITPDLCSSFEQCASSLCNATLYVLTRGFHPNQPSFPKEEVMRRIAISHDAFQRMEADIRQVLTATYGDLVKWGSG